MKDFPIRFDKAGYIAFNPLFMVDVVMLLEGYGDLSQEEKEFAVDWISEGSGKVSRVSGEELTLQVESGVIGEKIINFLDKVSQMPLDDLEKLINENRESMQEEEEKARIHEKELSLA